MVVTAAPGGREFIGSKSSLASPAWIQTAPPYPWPTRCSTDSR